MFKEKFVKLCADRGESPSAVAKKVGISSAAFSQWTTNTVPRMTTILKIAEYFSVSPDYLLGKEEKLEPNAVILNNKKVHLVPVYESVSAGFGTAAVDDIVDYYPCYIESAIEAQESLCIVVRGDSMAPKIEDGDLIQIHKQTSVDSGSFAVVLLDREEALVKKVYYGKDWIELHSVNPMYKMQRFEGADVLRLRVLGMVRAIIKKL